MSKSPTFTLASALSLVFGTPPFGQEYTTAHIGKVLSKLLGQDITEEQLLAALREAEYAHPRPGSGKHLLKWRFTRADGTPTPGRAKKAGPKRRERSIADSMNLKL